MDIRAFGFRVFPVEHGGLKSIDLCAIDFFDPGDYPKLECHVCGAVIVDIRKGFFPIETKRVKNPLIQAVA